jgi:hypothetical protein
MDKSVAKKVLCFQPLDGSAFSVYTDKREIDIIIYGYFARSYFINY